MNLKSKVISSLQMWHTNLVQSDNDNMPSAQKSTVPRHY